MWWVDTTFLESNCIYKLFNFLLLRIVFLSIRIQDTYIPTTRTCLECSQSMTCVAWLVQWKFPFETQTSFVYSYKHSLHQNVWMNPTVLVWYTVSEKAMLLLFWFGLAGRCFPCTLVIGMLAQKGLFQMTGFESTSQLVFFFGHDFLF